MEEIKLPTVPELSLIPIEAAEIFRKRIQQSGRNERSSAKEKKRDNAARGLVTVTVASMMLNAVMAVIIYILQAGRIEGGEQRNERRNKERRRRRNELHLRTARRMVSEIRSGLCKRGCACETRDADRVMGKYRKSRRPRLQNKRAPINEAATSGRMS